MVVTLDQPSKRYITGVSMGGHVAGAAIERETQETANNFVPYDGCCANVWGNGRYRAL